MEATERFAGPSETESTMNHALEELNEEAGHAHRLQWITALWTAMTVAATAAALVMHAGDAVAGPAQAASAAAPGHVASAPAVTALARPAAALPASTPYLGVTPSNPDFPAASDLLPPTP